MLKVTSFSVIETNDGKRISYTMKELNDSGDIIKSNIRKSMPVLETETDIVNMINTLEMYILSKQEV